MGNYVKVIGQLIFKDDEARRVEDFKLNHKVTWNKVVLSGIDKLEQEQKEGAKGATA